jgi:hypothetical protein
MATVFYVYEHWRPDTGRCFYVGKGKGGRANAMRQRNRHHKFVQKKLARLGLAVEVKIISGGLTDDEAIALEIERIAFWRLDGTDLTNMTDGGEGFRGKHTEETKRRLSEYNKGKPAAFKGRKHTEETKRILSEAAKLRDPPKLSPEAVEKAAASHRGRKRSLETCARISASKIGKPGWAKGKPSPLRGRKINDDVRARMSAAAIARWARKA